jgi:secernin
MCDTMVALPNVTKDGTILFAKNSDRQPNEPLLLTYIPRKKHTPSSNVKCTYISVDQVEETYELFLYKPSWMWGGEMGTNEFGLTIGNEAVFTKEKVNKTGLLGMDLIRLALERCKTAEEAVHCITDLIETYGQGGNCGYEKPFTYHNSFLIADYDSAWILETADKMWVAKKVEDFAAISNRLSIGEYYDLAHPDVVDYAIERGWHKKGESFHFAKSYSDFLYTKFSGSQERRSCANDILAQQIGKITHLTMMAILQSHEEESDLPPIHHFSVKSVCMHAGFLYGDHATGSYCISLKKGEPLVGWVTGSSTPCISLFKPFTLFEDPLSYIWVENDDEALNFWLKREYIHRRLMNATIAFLQQYEEERKQVQEEIISLYKQKQFHKAWENENEFIKKYDELLVNYDRAVHAGNFYFKRYWSKRNKKLYHNHPQFFMER